MVEFEQWYADCIAKGLDKKGYFDKKDMESAWLNGYDQGYVDGQEESDE